MGLRKQNKHRRIFARPKWVWKHCLTICSTEQIRNSKETVGQGWRNAIQSKWAKEKLLTERDDYGYNTWHRAARQGRLEALETLWSLAKEAELNTDELLLAQTRDGYTAFLLAAEKNHVGILKRLWVWAEESIVLLPISIVLYFSLILKFYIRVRIYLFSLYVCILDFNLF